MSETVAGGVGVMGRCGGGSGADDEGVEGEGRRRRRLLITAVAMMLPMKSLTHWASVRRLDCSTRDMSTVAGAREILP